MKTTFSRNELIRSVLVIFAVLVFTSHSEANAATIVVPAGGNIQAAINAAQFGDTIILQAGATYETPGDFQPYTLPNKGNGTSYITITSSAPAPADGTRVTLASRANMPKLVVKKGSTFFEALRGAHHYRLSNLWFTNKQGGTTTQLLGINGEDITHSDPRDPQVDWPHDIVVDHCFFNPVEWDMYPEANLCSSVNTAVGLVGINVTIRDSMMKGFGARYGTGVGANLPGCGTVAQDGESVLMVTPPGPMLIDNNQMETWFVAFFIGGGDPGSMYGGTVMASPVPTLTSATLSNVNGLRVGENIAFEMNNESPTFRGITVASGTITSISGNNVTFTHLVGKWGSTDSYIKVPVGAARPKTVDDAGGVAPCSPNYLGAPKWCSRAYWGGYNPSNITITRNYINKPTRWYDYMGSDGKGFFEIKLCDTCLIDGNIFEGRTGFTITVRNQGGRAPWSAIRNLKMSNNLATRFSAGFYTLFFDNEQLSTESHDIVFENNLMYGEFNDSAYTGFLPRVFSGFYGDKVRISHNTILQSGRIMTYGSSPASAGIDELTNFVFKDNIVKWGTGDQSGYACLSGAPEVCTPGYIWTKNAMIGAPTGPVPERQSLVTFPGNWNPATVDAVGFTNPAAGNYRLLSTSPYYRAASDGKDVGVDMDQLLAHISGPIPVPTPTPTPSVTPTPSPTPTPSVTPTPTPTPTAGTVSIKGYVFADGVRVPGALVQVAGQQMSSRVEDAFFWFDGIPIGATIVVTKAGFTFPQVTVQTGVPDQLYFVQGYATSTPTPTPTPTPAPTPTPTPTQLTVSITNPGNNSIFSLGTSVTVGASASATGGSVTSVGFYVGSELIGTSTLAPYSVTWNNMASGTYYLKGTAQDNRGLSASSSPITVKISKSLKGVRNGKRNASAIESSLTEAGAGSSSNEQELSSADLGALVIELEQTYLDFSAEWSMFNSANQINKYLFAAVVLARSSAALAIPQIPSTGVRDRLKKLQSYLSFSEDLMVADRISAATLDQANRVNAFVDLSITQPSTRPVGSTDFMLLPNGTGKVTALSLIPFTTQTVFAPGGGTSFELGDVSLTISGRAASLLSVSPTEITFSVPNGLTGGLADIVLTSREGYISHSTASVAGLNPTIFAQADNSTRAAILNGLGVHAGVFSTMTTPQTFGFDLRTRLSILATGISTGITNTNFSNDIWLGNGQVLANLAESVVVEARTAGGAVVRLPVEYAGKQGVLSGLDQVNVILSRELAGAGSVQLTVVVGGARSNPVTIVVQ